MREDGYTGPCCICGVYPCICLPIPESLRHQFSISGTNIASLNLKFDMIDNLIFREAALKICDELDNRGFCTDTPESAQGLEDKITQIIEETVRGNANYSYADAPAHEIDGSGWSGDLQNQIT